MKRRSRRKRTIGVGSESRGGMVLRAGIDICRQRNNGTNVVDALVQRDADVEVEVAVDVDVDFDLDCRRRCRCRRRGRRERM